MKEKNNPLLFAWDYNGGRLTEYGHSSEFDLRAAEKKVNELGRPLTEEEAKKFEVSTK